MCDEGFIGSGYTYSVMECLPYEHASRLKVSADDETDSLNYLSTGTMEICSFKTVQNDEFAKIAMLERPYRYAAIIIYSMQRLPARQCLNNISPTFI